MLILEILLNPLEFNESKFKIISDFKKIQSIRLKLLRNAFQNFLRYYSFSFVQKAEFYILTFSFRQKCDIFTISFPTG